MRLVVLLLALPALGACTPPATPALGCDDAQVTDLGQASIDVPAWFTTSGGRHRFSVSDPSDGTIGEDFDITTVLLGDAASTPTRVAPGDQRLTNSDADVQVDPEHPGTVDLPAGSYWLVNGRGSTTMATCADTTISGVVPGLGAVATSTPSPTS